MYNQDNAQHLKRRRKKNNNDLLHPQVKRLFIHFGDAAIQYLYKHLHIIVNTEVLHVMQHYG